MLKFAAGSWNNMVKDRLSPISADHLVAVSGRLIDQIQTGLANLQTSIMLHLTEDDIEDDDSI
jgi:hypothetical protein